MIGIQIYNLLTVKQKRKVYILFAAMMFSAFLELLSIGLILPIFTVIFDKNYINIVNNYLINLNFEQFIFEDYSELVLFSFILLFLIFLFKNLTLLFFNWYQFSFAKDVSKHLSNSLFDIFINQPYEFFFNTKSPQLIRNINSEPNSLVKSVLFPFIQIIMETTILSGLLILLLFNYGLIVFFILIGLVFIVLLISLFTKNYLSYWGTRRFTYESERIKLIVQSFNNIKDIILSKKNQVFTNNYKHNTGITLEASFMSGFIKSIPRLLIEQLIIGCFIIYFFISFKTNGISKDLFTNLVFVGAIVIRMLPSFTRITISYQTIRFSKTPQKKILDFFKLEKNLNHYSKQNIEFNNKIEFKNIYYDYNLSDKKTLKNLSFEIKKYDVVGITGTTGSGKSTLLDIFLGLLKPKDGKIIIDGNDFTNDLNSAAWQAKIGYVPQKIILLDESIKQNIALGEINEKVNDQKLENAIKLANLNDYIESLTEGVHTQIGEKGNLSGGQAQRIGIARALYNDPEILCFDEATSALDHNTENKILDTIDQLKEKKTIIIISHKQNTLKFCNKIIELQNGELINS